MIKKTSILDLKGLVMNAYHSGEDPDSIEGGELKDRVNTAGYGLAVFLSKFYDPILQICDTPLNMIACLDDGSNHRLKIFPEYKSNRAKIKKDEVEQEQLKLAMDYAKQFLLSQGVTLVGSKGEEADDIVGYLCERLEGHKTVHTVDRDLVQLVNETTFVFIDGVSVDEMKDRVVIGGERQDLMVPPNLVVLYKSLVGDKSDGYGGVKGFGPAAWLSLVEEFGLDGMEELDELIANKRKTKILAVAEVTDNKAYAKCSGDFDNWKTMYQVARISPEIVDPRWIKRVPETARLQKVMEASGCTDLYSKYTEDCFTATLVTRDNLNRCLASIANLIDDTPFVAWDYETHDPKKIEEYIEAASPRMYVDMLNSVIAGCSFAFGRNVNHVFYFSVDHADTVNIDKSVILDVIKLIERENLDMVAQNVMFEGTITSVNLNHTLKSWQDTKLYAHHLDENGEVGLKALSRNYLNYKQTSYADTLAEAGATDMAGISGLDVLGYGADDAVVTGHLYQHFMHRTSLEGTRQFIHDYECPAVQVLVNAHIDGVTVDLKAIDRMKKADEVTIKESMSEIRGLLSKHAKEPNFEGVEALFDDQADYYKLKAQDLKNSNKDTVAESAKLRKLRMKEGCYYQDLEEIPNFKPWLPTIAGFNKVCRFLGLPDFDRISKPGIEDWLEELTEAQEGMDFVKAIPPASTSFAKREGEAYDFLAKMCTEILAEHSPKKTIGTELNMGSPNQNQNLFYVLLGLPIRLRTKVQPDSLRSKYSLPGSPATDETAVETAIANDCGDFPWKKEVLQKLLKYKTASTRMKIYWNVYPLWVKGHNKAVGLESDTRGFVHPGLNSCGTVTRRPTGSSPNLMQIAKGDVREMFVPQDDDHVICSIDFSSQELRLNADACQDATWLSAYQGDTPKDLHALTGSRVVGTLMRKAGLEFSYPKEPDGSMQYDFFLKAYGDTDLNLHKLVKDARAIGKTVNFSAQFGAQKGTLSRNLMVPEDEAQDYLDAYNKTFPMLAVWKQKVVAQAKIDGYVETAYGSRRHCPGINSRNGAERSRWERQVVNFIIQGTAADILKTVLTGLSASQILEANDAFLICPVYDELLMEVPKKNLHAVITGVSKLMSLIVPGGTIPMVPDTSFGPNWAQQHEVGVFPSEEKIKETLLKF